MLSLVLHLILHISLMEMEMWIKIDASIWNRVDTVRVGFDCLVTHTLD